MRMKIVLVSLMLCCLLLTVFAVVPSNSATETMGPYIDDLYIAEIGNPETSLASLRTGEIQAIIGVEDPGAFAALKTEGYRLVNPDTFGQQFITMNCKMWPTNNTDVRRAIAYVFPRDDLVERYVTPTGRAAYSLLPKSFGAYYNAEITRYDYDPDHARTILDNAGFTVDPVSGLRIDPHTGQPLQPIQLIYRQRVPAQYVGPRFATEMRDIGLPVDEIVVDRATWFQRVLDDRTYNIEIMGGQAEVTAADYLFSLFHSSNDVPGGLNWAGVLEQDVQTELDSLLETGLYTLNVTASIEACQQAQALLADNVPRIPFYDITYPTAYSPTLKGIMEYPMYMKSHLNELRLQYKTQQGGTVRIAVTSHGDTLNVLTTVYEQSRWMIGLVTEGGIGMGVVGTNPYTMKSMPWIATDWKIEPWQAPGGVAGQKTTIWLKNGIYWHDGIEFTAEDIKFALLYLQQKQVPNALKVWQGLQSVNVVNPYQVEIYHNVTSLYMISLMDEYMSALPKHVWNDNVTLYGQPAGLPHIQDGSDYGVGDPFTFRPWEVSHPNVPGLTCLIGTGMFIYKDGNFHDYLHFVANRNYFRRMLESDVNIDFRVNILDIFSAAGSFGTSPGHPRWDVIADVNGDNKVDILDIFAIAKDFGKTW